MNVKTLTAPSIHAALLEARRLLGDDVVLLESVPPRGGEPARITVMTDKPLPPRQAEQRAPAAASGFGYAAAKARPQAALVAEESARGDGGFSVPPRPDRALGDDGDDGFSAYLRRSQSLPARREPAPEPPPARRQPARGRLFPEEPAAPASTAVAAPAGTDAIESLLRDQLKLLHERLDLIERRFEHAIIGAAQRWTAHPLFKTLLDQGLRPGTVTRLFDGLAAKGYQPDTNEETLRWALAQALRRTLEVTTPKHVTGTQLVIGPSGAGKTSLLLKLATHPAVYGRRRTTVIVVLPEEEDDPGYLNPVELYRGAGLPVQSVRTVEEMHRALARVQHFDQLLIDTPPLPVQEGPARKMLVRLHRLVDPILPLNVLLALNATRSLDEFDAGYLRGLPLRPDALALTHLDETRGWGRIAEWMMALQLPVQYVSTSRRVPDGLTAFSPGWFVEEMMLKA